MRHEVNFYIESRTYFVFITLEHISTEQDVYVRTESI